MLRSACTLNRLTDHWQACKLDQLVTVQRLAVITHRQMDLQHNMTPTMNHVPTANGAASREHKQDIEQFMEIRISITYLTVV
jgi:hypothetical protein